MDIKVYDDRHGGPFDRGAADCYYRRKYRPHYFVGATMQSEEVTIDRMTPADIEAYDAGWAYNEMLGEYKDWGRGNGFAE